MDKEELIEARRKNAAFRNTEIGNLFEKFVMLHATAWQLDERSVWNNQNKQADKAWNLLRPVETELREKLMKIAGVE